jgi:hypothetical protein
MFLCKNMFVCACLYSLRVTNRLRSVPELWWIDDQDLVNHWSWDQALRVLRGWRSWASVWWRQVSSDLLCHIYFIIHQPAYHDQPKDWLALYLPCPRLPFGLLWLASYYCFTLINEHDVNTNDTMLSLWLWCWTGDTLRGLVRFLECLFVRTGSLDDRPRKQCNHEVVWDALG